MDRRERSGPEPLLKIDADDNGENPEPEFPVAGNNGVINLILHGATVSVAVRVAGLGLSYVANVMLSRVLGLEAFGEYAIALSWALVLTLPAKAGFDNSALRYASIYLERQDFAALRGFIRTATSAVVSVSAIIAAIIIPFFGNLMPVSESTRLWTALLIMPLALLAFYSVLMRTSRRIISAQVYEQCLRPGLVIVGVGGAALAGINLSPSSAMGVTTAATAGALVVLLVQFRKTFLPVRAQSPQYGAWREWLTVSMPMLMMGLIQELMNQIDIILLGKLSDARQVALFAASWRIASLVPFALVALGTMAGPLIANAYERRSTEDLHRISALVARAGFLFALVAAIFIYALAGPMLGLFGRGFSAATDVLSILLVGGIVNAFTGVVAYFATLTGRERQALGIFVAALTLSIVLNMWLIPRLGAVGSAVASTSATIAWNLIMLLYVRRTIGIDGSALALAPRATLWKR